MNQAYGMLKLLTQAVSVFNVKFILFAYDNSFYFCFSLKGNQPVPDETIDPVLKLKKSLEETKSKIKKIQLFKTENLEEKEEYI